MTSTLHDFFESYGQSLESFDAQRAASHYKLPCLLSSSDGATAFSDLTKLESLFVQGYSFFRQHGIAHARPQVLSRRNWADNVMKCKVQWTYFTSENELAYKCDYQYIVREMSKGEWRVEVAFSVDEREQVEAWLTRKTGTQG
jgi:hypothetical protein